MTDRPTELLPPPVVTRLLALTVGLALFGFSLALLVAADLGLDPWDVFHQGLARTIDQRLGLVVIATSLVVLALWVPLRERPGIGTIANAVMVGVVFEVSISVLPEVDGLVVRVGLLLAGIMLNAVATGLYVGAGLGPGPRDGLMTGLAARGPSIRLVRTAIEVTVLVIGWLLGGSVGVGTVLFALVIGPLVQVALRYLTIAAPGSGSSSPDPIRA